MEMYFTNTITVLYFMKILGSVAQGSSYPFGTEIPKQSEQMILQLRAQIKNECITFRDLYKDSEVTIFTLTAKTGLMPYDADFSRVTSSVVFKRLIAEIVSKCDDFSERIETVVFNYNNSSEVAFLNAIISVLTKIDALILPPENIVSEIIKLEQGPCDNAQVSGCRYATARYIVGAMGQRMSRILQYINRLADVYDARYDSFACILSHLEVSLSGPLDEVVFQTKFCGPDEGLPEFVEIVLPICKYITVSRNSIVHKNDILLLFDRCCMKYPDVSEHVVYASFTLSRIITICIEEITDRTIMETAYRDLFTPICRSIDAIIELVNVRNEFAETYLVFAVLKPLKYILEKFRYNFALKIFETERKVLVNDKNFNPRTFKIAIGAAKCRLNCLDKGLAAINTAIFYNDGFGNTCGKRIFVMSECQITKRAKILDYMDY